MEEITVTLTLADGVVTEVEVTGDHYTMIRTPWVYEVADLLLDECERVLMPGGHPGDAFLQSAQDMLHHDFGIGHATLQVETGDGACVLEPAEAI